MRLKIVLIITLFMFLIFIAGCSNKDIGANLPSSTGKQSIDAVNEKNNEIIIVIKNFEFIPNSVTIKSGDKIKWINEDQTTHTIKSEEVNSDRIGTGEVFEFDFSDSGSYDYICGLHPSIKGRIIVE